MRNLLRLLNHAHGQTKTHYIFFFRKLKLGENASPSQFRQFLDLRLSRQHLFCVIPVSRINGSDRVLQCLKHCLSEARCSLVPQPRKIDSLRQPLTTSRSEIGGDEVAQGLQGARYLRQTNHLSGLSLSVFQLGQSSEIDKNRRFESIYLAVPVNQGFQILLPAFDEYASGALNHLHDKMT